MGLLSWIRGEKPTEKLKSQDSTTNTAIIHPEEATNDPKDKKHEYVPSFTFVPYNQIPLFPNIVTDGIPHPVTTIFNAHDSKRSYSNMPEKLASTTATETCLNFIKDTSLVQRVIDGATPKPVVVTSQHLTADGLLAAYCLANQPWAKANAEMLHSVTKGMIHDKFATREAARIAFALKSSVNPSTSPLDPLLFAEKTWTPAQVTVNVYQQLAKIIPDLVKDPNNYSQYWLQEDLLYQVTLDAIQAGVIQVEQIPHLDLAMVKVDDRMPEYHPAGIYSHLAHGHNTIDAQKVLIGHQNNYEFDQRGQNIVDTEPLENRLNHHESKAPPILASSFWTCHKTLLGTKLSCKPSNLEWLMVKDEVVRYLAEKKLDFDTSS